MTKLEEYMEKRDLPTVATISIGDITYHAKTKEDLLEYTKAFQDLGFKTEIIYPDAC